MIPNRARRTGSGGIELFKPDPIFGKRVQVWRQVFATQPADKLSTQALFQDNHEVQRPVQTPRCHLVVHRGGHALQNGTRHADHLKPNAFLSERANKPCERRKFSWSCHRSSGVAARLRAIR